MSQANRIYWNKGGMRALAQLLIKHYGPTGPVSIIGAVDKLQKIVLPENRQRVINSKDCLTRFLPIYEEVKAEAERSNPPHPLSALPIAAAAPPAVEQQKTPAPLPQTEGPAVLQEAGPSAAPLNVSEALKEALSDFLSDTVIRAVNKVLTSPDVAGALHRLMLGRMPGVIREQEDSPAALTKHSPLMPQGAEKRERRTFLLCGFKPSQQHQFLQAFPDMHLKFWYAEKPNDGLSQLREKARSADYVLLTMEATSHAAVQVVQSVGTRLVRVTGGASAMMEALNRLKEKVQ